MRALAIASIALACTVLVQGGTIHKHPHDALRAAGVDATDFKLFRPRKKSLHQAEADPDRLHAARKVFNKL